MSAAPWDIFCRVVDNHGDAGVCWRLATDLAERGQPVRLWIDDASPLAWMAPGGASGVQVRPWPLVDAGLPPGEVVIEAFGCELPGAFIERMARAPRAPVWINLEYLSAEPFVERSHKLPSPQLGREGAGLRKWFFYPGFTPRTGGLIRERGLLERRRRFDARAWLGAHTALPSGDEQVVSLFCYEQRALSQWLDVLSARPTLLLATAGHAARQVAEALGPSLRRGQLRALLMPLSTQCDYDHLLWASDLNFVRGEDSFVRAQWAGKPFVWQIYPQQDGVHLEKLDAFLARFLEGASEPLSTGIRKLWHAWNVPGNSPTAPWAPTSDWQRWVIDWREALARQSDLCSQLLQFVAETR